LALLPDAFVLVLDAIDHLRQVVTDRSERLCAMATIVAHDCKSLSVFARAG
jgi:hypothetical protein